MPRTVAECLKRARDLEAFERYLAAMGGPRVPIDIPIMEYMAGSLGATPARMMELLGYKAGITLE